jgi:hypothetical protein
MTPFAEIAGTNMSIGPVGSTPSLFLSRFARVIVRPPSEAATSSAGGPPRQGSALGQSLDRLFNTLGDRLGALHARRDALAEIKSQLIELRSSLQSAGRQGLSSGPAVLREIVEDIELSVERAVYGTRDVFETRPVYEMHDIMATRDVYETRPVYEQRDILATIVTGTRDLSGFSSISAAGIDIGADLSIQVGSDALATIKFSSSSKIALTISGATTNFNFSSNNGSWRTGLLDALNSIANLSAQYTADGRLQLQTSDAQSLALADVPNGFLDFSGSPLPKLGLTAGTTQASVVGTEQVEVGTEEVVVGQEQYVAGQEQVEVGTEQVKVGTEQAQTGTIELPAGTRSVTVGFDRVKDARGAARVEDIEMRIKELAGAVDALASSARSSMPAGSADGAQMLAADLAALLQSPDFAALARGGNDDGALDRLLSALDDASSDADMLETQLIDESAKLADAGQADLAALLLNSGLQFSPGEPSSLARLTAAMLIGSPNGLIGAGRMSIWS